MLGWKEEVCKNGKKYLGKNNRPAIFSKENKSSVSLPFALRCTNRIHDNGLRRSRGNLLNEKDKTARNRSIEIRLLVTLGAYALMS